MTRIAQAMALLLVGAALVAPVLAQEDRILLAAYEQNDGHTRCEGGQAEYLTTGAAAGRGALRWKVPANADQARLITRIDTLDIREHGLLRLRYRLADSFDGVIWVGLYSEKGSLANAITEPSAEWCTLEIPLAGMFKRNELEPAKIDWLVFEARSSGAFQIDLDEVELIRTRGGWRGDGGEGFAYNVADFEVEARSQFDSGDMCRAKVVADGDGRVLRLTARGEFPLLGVSIGNLPEDLRPFRLLTFRARVVKGSGRGLDLLIMGGGGYLMTELPRLTGEWARFEVLLPELEASETFNPLDADGLQILGHSSGKRVVEFDDFSLVVQGAGWQYTALERLRLGRQDYAPLKTVADFERDDAADRVDVRGCEVERVRVKRRRGNSSGAALRVTFPEGGEKSELILRQVPTDLRKYRILRFLARVDRAVEADVQVRLCSRGGLGTFSFLGGAASLAFDVIGFGRNWKQYELFLPEAHRLGDFEPQRVTGLKITRSGPLTLYLDQFELVKGGGGCLNSSREEMKRLFGDEAADRIREIETKRYRVWTDIEKPDRKLGGHLEAVWEHARKILDLPPPVRPVEVYLFAKKEVWAKPLLKEGWTVQKVAAAAGHSYAGSLSTYDQDYNGRPFVRDLTRSILQRTVGGGGGEWLQDGVAGYVASRWKKQSPADEYREQVAKRRRVPLRDLLVMPWLLAEARGRPRLMAAAFVEFLLCGPRAKQTKEALGTLVLLDSSAPAYLEAVEKTLGASLDDLDEEWALWLDRD